ncbi:MAG: O-antigen ligase family protein [Thermoanaerobaculia bacterium]|nr:O-antigen ligase family protein [Thermoanaerobaculia bacterium]
MIRHVRPRALALAALLVAAPLPFGSVAPEPATILLVAALAALVLAIWTVEVVDRPEPASDSRSPHSHRSLPRELALAAAALAAVALLGWLQSLPAPAAVTGLLAPETVRLTQQARALAGPVTEVASGDEAASGDSDRSIALSLAPAASRSAALDWLLPVAGFLAAAWIGASRRVRRTLFGALLLAATVQVVIGVAQWISRSNTLWGVTVLSVGSRLRGSFVNPNHLALFLEIALAVAFAWLWWAVRRTVLGGVGADGGRAEDRLLAVGPPAVVFLAIFGGLVLTGSRAALLSVIIAMGVQGMVISGGGSGRGRKWILAGGLAVGVAGAAAIAALGAEGAFTRLTASSLDELGGGYRIEAAGATFDLFQLFPWAGSGLGTFQAAFPLVQPATIPGFWRHAHADWIEYLATTGMLGALLLGTGLFFYARRLRQVVLYGERSEGRAAGLAALGALVAVGIHSFADFGLTMPANAFALAVVAGAAGATRIPKKP